MCPKLTVPANGAVVPSSCGESDSQYGVECFFECDAGYVLKGPRFTTCQGDNSWSDMASISCEKGKESSLYHTKHPGIFRVPAVVFSDDILLHFRFCTILPLQLPGSSVLDDDNLQ